MAKPNPKTSSAKRPRKPRPTAGTLPAGETPQPQQADAVEPKRRGRPPKAKETVDVPEGLGKDLVVLHIPFDQIDLDDTRYRFRAVLRVPDLIKSIRESGQQIPAVVRPHPDLSKGKLFQLISGFRRATALVELQVPTLAAYVREDLADDGKAFQASVLENLARKTYSDIDRAYIIRRYRDEGHTGFSVEGLMHLSDRQQRHLLSLLDLPKVVQQAIASEAGTFRTTHALTLRKLKGKYKQLEFAEWVKRVNAEELSISQLIRKVNEAYRNVGERQLPSIFRTDGTSLADGKVRLRPVKFDLVALSETDRHQLRTELAALLERLNLVGKT